MINAVMGYTMGNAMVNEVRKKKKSRNPYKKNYRPKKKSKGRYK